MTHAVSAACPTYWGNCWLRAQKVVQVTVQTNSCSAVIFCLLKSMLQMLTWYSGQLSAAGVRGISVCWIMWDYNSCACQAFLLLLNPYSKRDKVPFKRVPFALATYNCTTEVWRDVKTILSLLLQQVEISHWVFFQVIGVNYMLYEFSFDCLGQTAEVFGKKRRQSFLTLCSQRNSLGSDFILSLSVFHQWTRLSTDRKQTVLLQVFVNTDC